jgi:hypothetical protein
VGVLTTFFLSDLLLKKTVEAKNRNMCASTQGMELLPFSIETWYYLIKPVTKMEICK